MDKSASFSANFYFFACLSIRNAVYSSQRLRSRSLSLPTYEGKGIPARAAQKSLLINSYNHEKNNYSPYGSGRYGHSNRAGW